MQPRAAGSASVDPLGGSPGDCHDGGLVLVAKCAVQLLVLEKSRGTEDETLEVVEPWLGGLQVVHHFHKGLVVLVEDAELLVQQVLDGVLLVKGLVVDDGGGVADPFFY